MTQNTILKLIGSFAVALVFGASLYAFFAGPTFFYLWTESRSGLNSALQMNMERNLSVGRNLLYGTIISVDTRAQTIKMSVPLSYAQDSPPARVLIRVLPNAHIAYQELSGTNGVFDTLTEERPAPLSSLYPGAHVTVMALRDTQGKLVTSYLLFGEPL